MPNSNNSSNNHNDQRSARPSTNSSNSNTPPLVSPHIGDVPMFGRRYRTRTEPYQVRSIRRSATGRADSRRKWNVNLHISRRILALRNDARRTLLSAIADTLQINDSPPDTSNQNRDDRISYNIELRGPNHDDSSVYTRDEYNADYPVNNENNFHGNLNGFPNILGGNEENNTPWSGSYLFNAFQNLFQRNPSSENQE